jgi:ketosteroid isomerase-like protein
MSQENVETLKRMIDAFNRGDRDATLADYAPEAEWHTTGRFADEHIYRGRAGIGRLLAEIQEDIEGLNLSVADIRAVSEDKVLASATWRGRGKRSKAPFEEPASWFVVTFRDRQVVRVENYIDFAAALEAAGLSE